MLETPLTTTAYSKLQLPTYHLQILLRGYWIGPLSSRTTFGRPQIGYVGNIDFATVLGASILWYRSRLHRRDLGGIPNYISSTLPLMLLPRIAVIEAVIIGIGGENSYWRCS